MEVLGGGFFQPPAEHSEAREVMYEPGVEPSHSLCNTGGPERGVAG